MLGVRSYWARSQRGLSSDGTSNLIPPDVSTFGTQHSGSGARSPDSPSPKGGSGKATEIMIVFLQCAFSDQKKYVKVMFKSLKKVTCSFGSPFSDPPFWGTATD